MISLFLLHAFTLCFYIIIFPPSIEKEIRVAPIIIKGRVSEEDTILDKQKIKTTHISIRPNNTNEIVFFIFIFPFVL